MNCNSNVHWYKKGSNLLIDINLEKEAKIKGELSDKLGKCVMHVFDKFFKKGNHRILKRVDRLMKGPYFMKISTGESSNVIRFFID